MATRNVCFLVLMPFVLEHNAEVIAQVHLGCHNYGGNEAGRRIHSSVTLSWCQDLCKTTTYFALRRLTTGGTASVGCYCSGSVPGKIADNRCGLTCNGLKCGGRSYTTRKSLYTTCSGGRYGSDPVCGNECHCKSNARCPITDGSCSNGCQPNWNGTSCNVCEINWEGTNCDVCAQNWQGANCDRCITGWQGTDCLQDVDECSLGLCEQHCDNFDGGFNCSCKTGYKLDGNQRNCTDVNECDSFPCEHKCNNTVGSFLCSCPDGFQLAGNGRNCTDIDQCAAGPCGRHGCVDGVNGYTCQCNAGFRLEQGGKLCIDIDECQEGNHSCPQNCSNTAGSYKCLCSMGYRLETDGSCTGKTEAPLAGTDQSAYIGAGAGGAVLICAAIVVTVIMVKRRRSQKATDNTKAEYTNEGNGLIPLDTVPDRAEGLLYSEPKPSPQPSRHSTASVVEENDVTETCVPVTAFMAYVQRRKSEEKPFSSEFQRLPGDETGEVVAAKREGLLDKNRFKNILPYDETRVRLDVLDDNPLTDYINASYIQGSSMEERFIAATGPTKNTLIDFWRMIWEQDVHLIAMVTRLDEGGTSKCTQYWPDGQEGSSEEYGDITVELNKEDLWMDNVLRKFKVKKDSETRDVTHMHFTSWPDHGVPHNATSMTNFVARVGRKMAPRKPTLVHCSAGVGRTGTLIGLHLLLQQWKKEEVVDVFSCISKLRQQRMTMVQSLAQYVFLHDALAEVFTTGETSIPCDTFTDNYAELAASDTNNNVTKIQAQFQLLVESQPVVTEEIRDYALSKQNKHKNRDTDVLPVPGKRVFLLGQVPGGNDYINAAVVGGYRKPGAFLTTQMPLEGTVKDYWRLILDNHCRAIVLLKGEGDPEDIPMFVPEEGTPIEIHQRKVIFHSEQTEDGILVKEVHIVASDPANGDGSQEAVYANVDTPTPDKPLKLKVFCFPTVEGSRLAPGPCVAAFFRLQTWQQQSGDKPIVVTCLNGASLSGQYVVCSNLFEMTNSEGEVDIYQMVRHAKDCQPMFVNTRGQYSHMYDAVQVYLDSFELYHNFK